MSAIIYSFMSTLAWVTYVNIFNIYLMGTATSITQFYRTKDLSIIRTFINAVTEEIYHWTNSDYGTLSLKHIIITNATCGITHQTRAWSVFLRLCASVPCGLSVRSVGWDEMFWRKASACLCSPELTVSCSVIHFYLCYYYHCLLRKFVSKTLFSGPRTAY